MLVPKHIHPTIGVCAFTAPGAALCYQEIIRYSDELYGLDANPNVVIIHPNFADMHQAVSQKDWANTAAIMLRVFQQLAEAGADLGIVPINTVHYAIEPVIARSPIPILSLLDVVAEHIMEQKYQRVLVLGTEITMQGLYVTPIQMVGVAVTHPNQADQHAIHDIIFGYLLKQENLDEAGQKLLKIIEPYKAQCDAIVLACTELPMVLNTENCGMPVMDTTRLLARAAIDSVCG